MCATITKRSYTVQFSIDGGRTLNPQVANSPEGKDYDTEVAALVERGYLAVETRRGVAIFATKTWVAFIEPESRLMVV